MRLHRLDVLPMTVFVLESDDVEAARARIPRPVSNKRTGSSGSLLSRAIARYAAVFHNLGLPHCYHCCGALISMLCCFNINAVVL